MARDEAARIGPWPPSGPPGDAPAGPRGGAVADRLTGLAARLLGTKYALVSLLSDERGGLSVRGGTASPVVREGPLDSLGAVTARLGGPLAVTDAAHDSRVAHLTQALAGELRSYLGVPLRHSDGELVGALCVFDPAPRTWRESDVQLLEELAASVSAELELAEVSADLAATAARLELAFAAADLGSFDWDLRTVVVFWDDRLRAIFGYHADTFVPHIDSFTNRLHPGDRQWVGEAIAEAVGAGGDFGAEYRVVRPDATTRWVIARGRVLRDEAGHPVRLLGAAYDSTAARTSRDFAARVLETMSTAFFSLAPDWTVTYVNAEGERALGRERADMIGRNFWEVLPETIGSVFDREYHRAVETGQSVAFDAFYPPLDRWYEVRAWPFPDGLSVYFHDISARRRAESGRAEAVAEREEATLGRAQAAADRESAVVGREQAVVLAQRATRRLQVLADAGSAMSTSLDPASVLTTLCRTVVPALGDWVVVGVRHEIADILDLRRSTPSGARSGARSTDDVVVVRVAHSDLAGEAELDTLLGRAVLSIDDPAGMGWVTGTGLRHWQPAQPAAAHEPARAEADRLRDYRPGDAVLTVPLISGGRTLGAMAVGAPSDDPEDRRLVEELGVRAGAALDNAALYDTERRLGLTLQRSLLPGQLPQLPGLELAARYLPGTEGTEVGGDFYLARVLPDGRMLLMLGDVMGHGIPAAARMGQLRTMLATLAYSGCAPDVVLTRAAEQAEELIDLQLATVLVAIYDPAHRELTVASAGHPPPLLAPIASEPAFVDLATGPPLGVGKAVYRAVTVPVPGAATLVFYTDGLIEERGEAIDEGLERLRQALREVRLPPEAVCTHVLHELGRSRGGEDDVALLVLSHADPVAAPISAPNDNAK